MSTTQEQFEAMLVLYYPCARMHTFENSEGIAEYYSVVENLAWKMWQAATEAAKATGTAGELPPLPVDTGLLRLAESWAYDFALGQSSTMERQRKWQKVQNKIADQMRAYGEACAEAARQPAPVSTVPCAEDFDTVGLNPYVVQEADIIQKFPLNDAQIDKIARAYFAEEYAQTHVKNAIRDAFVEAAPNRSQP